MSLDLWIVNQTGGCGFKNSITKLGDIELLRMNQGASVSGRQGVFEGILTKRIRWWMNFEGGRHNCRRCTILILT